jgi:hypothetical protein
VPGWCNTPNVYTGGCSCPAGTSEIRTHIRRNISMCSSTIEADLVFCAGPMRAGEYFQGVYQYFSDSMVTSQCIVPNPYTSSCACPPGSRQLDIRVKASSSAPVGIFNAITTICVE